MLKIEVKIEGVWIELNPVFDGFQIIKYRDEVQLLQIRYETAGNLKLYNADFDLLFPYLSVYNIECRVTESVNGTSVYNAYLNLDREVNFTTDFIKANITIIDDYYNFYFNPIYNENYKFELNKNVTNTQVFIDYFKQLSISTETNDDYYYTNNGFLLKNVFTYLLNQIKTGLNFSFEFLEKYSDVFIIKNSMLESDFSENSDILLSQDYSNNDFSDSISGSLVDESFKLSLNELTIVFANIFSVYWYIDNTVFNFTNFKDFVFTNGIIDLTDYLNKDWIEEQEKIVTYENSKYSKIENNNTDYNSFNLYFENLKYNNLENSNSFTVQYNYKAIETNSYPILLDWKDYIVGIGLVNCNEITQFQPLFINYYYYKFKDVDNFIKMPFLNGNAFNNTEMDYLNVFEEYSVNGYDRSLYYDLAFKNENGTAGAKQYFYSKYLYCNKNQTITLVLNSVAKSYGVKINLKNKNGDVVGVKLFPQGAVEFIVSIPISDYYFYEFEVSGDVGGVTGQLILTNIKIFISDNVFEVSQDFQNNIGSYNSKFLPKFVFDNYKCNLPFQTGIIEDTYNDIQEEITDLHVKNDKTQIIQAPIDLNLENIDFSKKIKTNLGWMRLDKVEREYNTGYNSFCNLTLTTNKIVLDESVLPPAEARIYKTDNELRTYGNNPEDIRNFK